jgi:hypothetical protein
VRTGTQCAPYSSSITLYLAMSMCSSVMAVVDLLKSLRMRRCMDAATHPAAACHPGNTATAACLQG